MKVQELIDRIIAKCGVEPLDRTCDQVIEGDPQTEITGIVTTFMATVDVIREAYRVGANLIITHEPTYFTGDDERDWLAQDPVYFEKRQLLLQCGICVWRFHDYLHMATEGDGIYRGLLRELGWLMESLREYRAALEKNDLPELTRLLEDNSIEDIPVRMVRDTGMLRRWQVRAPWKLGGQYTLTIPEGAITDVAGLSNDSIIRKYTVLDPEKFATVLIHVRGRDDGTKYIVQLLDGSNALKQEKRDVTTGDIRFNYVPAGEIKFREQPHQN